MARTLAEFAEMLEDLGSDESREEFAEECGRELTELVKQGFESGRAPSGAPWAPTKRGNSPLVDTGALAASPDFTADADGFTLRITDPKAVYHQRGTSRGIPARPMLPEGNLPPEWAERVRAIFARHVRKRLSR